MKNKKLSKRKTALFSAIMKSKFLSTIKYDLNPTWLKNMGFKFNLEQWEYFRKKLG